MHVCVGGGSTVVVVVRIIEVYKSHSKCTKYFSYTILVIKCFQGNLTPRNSFKDNGTLLTWRVERSGASPSDKFIEKFQGP